jgi:DNA-binding CsgD family transcriptional regulator
MRTGRYGTAVSELQHGAVSNLPGRELLLHAALSAGLARRNGDIARLRDAWSAAASALARQTVDLFAVEPLEELLVAATRLRQPRHVEPVLELLDGIIERLDRPAAWSVAVDWVRLQLAVAGEDAAAAASAAAAMAGRGARTGRPGAQCAAAPVWASALAGDVNADTVTVAADELAAAQLPWEASRLVGHAAIRTSDAAAARRLLERARELSSMDLAGTDTRPDAAGLSEREVEVARMVLAGATHREIGARLFISPKTVEHHVARIRTKLGVTSRAEFVAALRELLGDAAPV